MPRIKTQKIAIGYLQIKNTSTPGDMPRDIGNPAEARVDTLKWMKGEGPVPELQLCTQVRDDDEVVDPFLKNICLRHPAPLTDIGEFGTRFLFEVQEAQKELMRHSHTQLEKKIAPYSEGQSSGGRTTAEPHKLDQESYIRILRDHYKKIYKRRDRTQRLSYRREADLLLTQSGIQWIDPDSKKELTPPQEDRLRKSILPPLLRALFPRLYSS